MSKITVKSYKVKSGDCFLINYDKVNILIDTGFGSTFDELKNDLKEIKKIDLLILTHIDNDHINGAINILDHKQIIKVDRVWYNGYQQIFNIKSSFAEPSSKVNGVLENVIASNQYVEDNKENYEVGYVEAEALEEKLFDNKVTINNEFSQELILAEMEYKLNDDIEFYFLSPSQDEIDVLKEKWCDELQNNDCYESRRNIKGMPKAFEFYFANEGTDEKIEYEVGNTSEESIDIDKLVNKIDKSDSNEINCSSLAFIISIKGCNMLFMGDSNPDLVAAGMKKLITSNQRFREIELLKVSHHGSRYNTNNNILSHINISKCLISTNGSPKLMGISTKPHNETLAKILYYNPSIKIYLNYPKDEYNNKIYELIDIYTSKYDSNAEIINGIENETLTIEMEV